MGACFHVQPFPGGAQEGKGPRGSIFLPEGLLLHFGKVIPGALPLTVWGCTYMPYTHKTSKGEYVLYTRDVELKGGRMQTIYFFAKKGNKPASGKQLDAVPAGKKIGINSRTGLPFLSNAVAAKKKK